MNKFNTMITTLENIAQELNEEQKKVRDIDTALYDTFESARNSAKESAYHLREALKYMATIKNTAEAITKAFPT